METPNNNPSTFYNIQPWELNKALIVARMHVLIHMICMISAILGASLISEVRRTEKEFVGVRKGFTTPEQTPTISLVSRPPKTEEAKTPLIREESEQQDRLLQDGEPAVEDEASMRFSLK